MSNIVFGTGQLMRETFSDADWENVPLLITELDMPTAALTDKNGHELDKAEWVWKSPGWDNAYDELTRGE